MNWTMVCLSLGTLVVVGACDGGSGNADGRTLPGIADKAQAIVTIRQIQSVDDELASGDPGRIVDQVGWLFGNASLIVIAPPPATSGLPPSSSGTGATRQQHSASCNATSHGSASCDASGCVFAQFWHPEPDGGLTIVDGTISVAHLAPDGPTVALDLVIDGCQELVGPNHLSAAWIRTATRLEGSLRKTFEVPIWDDELVRFDGIALSDDQPGGGRLYAKWVSDEFGSHDTTVSFP